jgi:hypothetical protein
MIEFAVTPLNVEVAPAEYQRLLGYPRDYRLEDRAAELADAARAWYVEHGRPWVFARQSNSLNLAGGKVVIDGIDFQCPRLFATLSQAEADSVVMVAVSAGAELEQHANELWLEEKPDEYFFLEVYGSAVVEHLVTMKAAELCTWAESSGRAVLPHYSPGYPEWDIRQQGPLLRLICEHDRDRMPGELAALDSGMLRPKKSLLAVFGVTRHGDRAARLAGLVPCASCSYQPCQYRRAPYEGTTRSLQQDEFAQAKQVISQLLPATEQLDCNARYSVHAKALTRWVDSRLSLTENRDGSTSARFHYEGTTCSNMGRPLHFDYWVTLGSRESGYVLREMICRPSPGDEGFRSMCEYLRDSQQLMSMIDDEKPLLGMPLNHVLEWNPAVSSAGCYCDVGDRLHKWRLVLETIHFALAQRERAGNGSANNGMKT